MAGVVAKHFLCLERKNTASCKLEEPLLMWGRGSVQGQRPLPSEDAVTKTHHCALLEVTMRCSTIYLEVGRISNVHHGTGYDHDA